MRIAALVLCAASVITLVPPSLANASSVDVVVGEARRLPAVESLISSLQQERWSEDQLCLRATLHWLTALRNRTLWAAWIWDSMQPPSETFYGTKAFYGNYMQCLYPPWPPPEALKTRYCIVNVKRPAGLEAKEVVPLETADDFYERPSKYGRYINEQYVGVCLPAACGATAAARVYRHMVQDTLLAAGDVTVDVTVDHRDCQTAGDLVETSREFYMFWTVIGILAAIAFLSTYLCEWSNTKVLCLCTIAKPFCVKHNFNNLFRTSINDISSLHGIKFLSAVLIVFFHEAIYSSQSTLANYAEFDEINNSSLGKIIFHLDAVVDTFFTVSGLLLIRGLILRDRRNLPIMLLKRYLRLVGPFTVIMLYLMTAAIDMVADPYWKRMTRDETEVCQNYWWKSLLMINTDPETVCHIVSWYIACDYQLTIAAAFVYFLFKKNRIVGVITFVLFVTASTFYMAFNIYRRNLPLIPFSDAAFINFRQNTLLIYTYTSSFSRVSSFSVGLVMGFYMAVYNPQHYRQVISKPWSSGVAVTSLTIMAVVLCFGVMISDYEPLTRAVVVTSSRIAWGVAVCGLIVACEYGSLRLISRFLGWPGFVPLSKLSYSLYLVHTLVMQRDKFTGRSLRIFGYFSMLKDGFGVLVISCGLSFMMYLIVEAPLLNI